MERQHVRESPVPLWEEESRYTRFALTVVDELSRKGLVGDVRVEVVEREDLTVENGRIRHVIRTETQAWNVRVWGGSVWGFAASSRLLVDEIPRKISEAVQQARANRAVGTWDLRLVPEVAHRDRWSVPVEEDPFALSLEAKLQRLLTLDARLQAPFVVRREIFLSTVRRRKVFASTWGSLIVQDIPQVGVGYTVSALDAEGGLQVRSYPTSLGGNWALGGLEWIERFRLAEEAPRVVEELERLLHARPVPAEETTLVIASDQMALQIHESVGHALELDRILGYEAAYAGTSWVTLEHFGRLRYGSPLMHVVADATLPHGLGSFGYDDEGVPARRYPLIEEGVLRNALSSRDTAPVIGETESGGTVRAESALHLPIIRMTNVNLLPGDTSLEALIGEVDHGYLLATNRSWSIDMKRLNFQFSTEIAWRIEKGRLVEVMKNPVYYGITPEFWRNMDAVGDSDTWTLWGVPNCGKGEPPQVMGVGHGAPYARFRRVQVGSTSSV